MSYIIKKNSFFPSYHNQFVYLVYLVSLPIIIFYYIIKIKNNLFDPVIDFIPSLEHAYDATISYFYTKQINKIDPAHSLAQFHKYSVYKLKKYKR